MLKNVGVKEKSKQCSTCKKRKAFSSFYDRPGSKDGKRSQCSKCIYRTIRRNPERIKAINERTKRWQRELRIEVLNYYSNGLLECACCQEDNLEFLALDHIGGGGNEHRREINLVDKSRPHGTSAGLGMFLWIKRNNFPLGFQVLCHNCNCSIGFYGYCPHQNNSPLQAQEIKEFFKKQRRGPSGKSKT